MIKVSPLLGKACDHAALQGTWGVAPDGACDAARKKWHGHHGRACWLQALLARNTVESPRSPSFTSCQYICGSLLLLPALLCCRLATSCCSCPAATASATTVALARSFTSEAVRMLGTKLRQLQQQLPACRGEYMCVDWVGAAHYGGGSARRAYSHARTSITANTHVSTPRR